MGNLQLFNQAVSKMRTYYLCGVKNHFIMQKTISSVFWKRELRISQTNSNSSERMRKG